MSAIILENVTKIYPVYEKPIHRLIEAMPFVKRRLHRPCVALSDINLTIPQGSTFGVLGRNGSGKSTLLQIIGSILRPTTGTVSVSGRVSALLELGSGFNPDFTGIENVYLYGSILGISEAEMDRILPSILEFAEIGDFVHLPLKTYSSGMVLRLAFATAVAVEPEILIVDEALAVGDAQFQHKCILRMREIMSRGVTVVFVSHDISSIKLLCDRAILLENGRIVADGIASDVAVEYHKRLFAEEFSSNKAPAGSDFLPKDGVPKRSFISYRQLSDDIKPSELQLRAFTSRVKSLRFGTGEAVIEFCEVINSSGRQTTEVEFGEKLTIRIYVKVKAKLESAVVGFILRNSRGVDIIVSNTHIEHGSLEHLREGELLVVDFSFVNTLRDDHYSVNVAVADLKYFNDTRPSDWVNNAVVIRTGKPSDTIVYGLFYPEHISVDLWRDPASSPFHLPSSSVKSSVSNIKN